MGDLETIIHELLEHKIEFVYSSPSCSLNSVFPTEALVRHLGGRGWVEYINFYVQSDDEDFLVWLKLKC